MAFLKYFKESEFDCKCGCGANNMEPPFLSILDVARRVAGIPFVVLSGCRCESHNESVGGVKDSAHVFGLAADIASSGIRSRFVIVKALLDVGFDRIGIYETFIHVDADQAKPAGVMWYGN